jgi:leader peptidase (prepilin peptidase) / N-methyltransferase
MLDALPISLGARLLIGAGLGLIVGSFLAAIVLRWPRGESVVKGRSRCDACGRTLRLIELVPLVSYFLARGRCRTCGAPIDRSHLVIELGCAAATAWIAVAAPWPYALGWAMLAWLLIPLIILDWRHFWLPDALTFPLAALGLTIGEWLSPPLFQARLIGAVAGLAGFLFIAWGYRRLRGRDGLGLGDAKLLGALGGWVGWQGLPLLLLMASAGGLVWALARHWAGHDVTGATRLPFGAFLCLAFAPAWLMMRAMGL